MTTSTKPLARDPDSWLLDRLLEVYQVNHEATVADGFDYALGFIDLGIGVEGINPPGPPEAVAEFTHMAQDLLDKNRRYGAFCLADECEWKFEYRPESSYRGTKFSWQAYRRRPGNSYWAPQGEWQELEIYRWLITQGQPLDWDDLIDFMLAMREGALEVFLIENRIPVTHDSTGGI